MVSRLVHILFLQRKRSQHQPQENPEPLASSGTGTDVHVLTQRPEHICNNKKKKTE